MTNPRDILFVSHRALSDDDRRTFETHGFRVVTVDFATAIDRSCAAVLINLSLGPDALDLIRSIRCDDRTKRLPVLATGEWGTGGPSVALCAGADAYEPTPINAERLITSIERLLTVRGLAAVASK